MNGKQKLLNKADTLTDTEVAEVLEYIGIMESLRDQPGRRDVGEDTLAFWARSLAPRDRNRRMRTPDGSCRV